MSSHKKSSFKPPRRTKGMTEGLGRFLEEQKNAFLPGSHLEVIGTSQAVLEGCKGVLAYSDEHIRLGCSGRTVCFSGKNLELRCLSVSTAVVTGEIASIQFER